MDRGPRTGVTDQACYPTLIGYRLDGDDINNLDFTTLRYSTPIIKSLRFWTKMKKPLISL